MSASQPTVAALSSDRPLGLELIVDTLARVRILIVDDQPAGLLTLEAVLGDLGHELVRAGSGREALRQLLAGDFAVILLDVQMPDLDGFETATLIRQRDQSRFTPIIFVTAGLHSNAQVFRGYSVGAVDYVFKPLVPEILRTKVSVFVELFRQRKAAELLAESRLAALENANRELGAANVALTHLALHDPLTGFLNRRGLGKALEQEAYRNLRSDTSLCAILIDCDDFKNVNDLYGHDVGDRVLAGVAEAINGVLRPTDHCARVGGDEFLVVLGEMRRQDGAQVAERIRASVAARRLSVVSGTIGITCSQGWAWVRPDRLALADLLSQLGIALKQSKSLGKDAISVSTPPLAEHATLQARDGSQTRSSRPPLDAKTMLDAIVSGEQLSVLCQAIYRLDDDAGIDGYELCSRGPPGALEMPEELFQAALGAGGATELDVACLHAAIRSVVERRVPPDGRIHVNVLPSTLAGLGVDALMLLLAPFVDRGCCVDLRETCIAGAPQMLTQHVLDLRSHGVTVALDDAGFSRGCLDALITLQPDLVKLAPRLVTGAALDPSKRRTLERIVLLAGRLGVRVVAVGIESAEDHAFARQLGCGMAQGFHLGRPSPI